MALGASASITPSGGGEADLGVSADVVQAVPGGGSISAGVAPSISRVLDSAFTDNATAYSLRLHQPLAAGAWGYSQPQFDIRVQKLTSAEAGAKFSQTVGSRISTVRAQYWTCYERKKTLAIAREAMAQSERVLAKDRVRFAVGEIALIDTLGSALAWLEAQQAVLNAEVAFTQARRSLALLLSVTADSVAVPDSLDIIVAPLPPVAELLTAVRSYDPTRSLFELAYEKLQLQLAQKRNALLPQVAATVQYSYNDARGGAASLAENSVFALIASYALPTRTRRIEISRVSLAVEKNRLEARERDLQLDNSAAALEENWAIEQQKVMNSQMAAQVALRKLDAAEKGYELGSIDQLAYLQARKDAFEAQTRALAQQVGLKRIEITFDEITGNVFSRFGVQVQ